MSSGKQYGLQIPSNKKATQGLVKKHAAFGDDSDSEKSDGGTDWTKRALKAGEKTTFKRQARLDIQRALEEDSSVYQYDELYDDLQKGKQEKTSREKDRKPKYIGKLMEAAEKRKIENERRVERQVQKEREAEGEEFKDKETFVTSAYKKKLEEFAKLDAEQKRMDMLEEIGDVTKQQDLGGFYRHLYETKMNGPKDDSKPKKESVSPTKDSKRGSKEPSPTKPPKEDVKKSGKKEARKYRKRKDSVSSTEKNKDADTDAASSSSSSSSESSDTESGEDKSSQSETENPKRLLSKREAESEKPPVEVSPAKSEAKTEVKTEPPRPKTPEEPKKSIWEKRTVGPVFDAALQRYLERKAARRLAAK